LKTLFENRAQMTREGVLFTGQNIQYFFVIGHNDAQKHFDEQKKHCENKENDYYGAENGVRGLERIVVKILQNRTECTYTTLLEVPEFKNSVAKSDLKSGNESHENAEKKNQKISDVWSRPCNLRKWRADLVKADGGALFVLFYVCFSIFRVMLRLQVALRTKKLQTHRFRKHFSL
jgi:hypothetical protein